MPVSKKVDALIIQINKCVKQHQYEKLPDLAKALKQAGAQDMLFNLDIQDEEGPVPCTLLMYFVLRGLYEEVHFLLNGDNPADPTLQNDRGQTALYLACKLGGSYDLRIIQDLLQHRPNEQVCVPCKRGFIPLSLTCQYGLVGVAELLLTYRIVEQLRFIEPEKFTALLSACYYGHVQMVQLLLKKIPEELREQCLLQKAHTISDSSESLITALHIAVVNPEKCENYPHLEIINTLLQYMPDWQLEAQDDVGRTALFLATVRRNLSVVQTLTAHKNNNQFCIKTHDGSFPLYRVIANLSEIELEENTLEKSNNLAILKLLLEFGPPAQIMCDFDGWLPIHKACEFGLIPYVRYLLDKDLQQFNKPNSDGWFPMHLAVYYGHVLLIQFLLSKYGEADRLVKRQQTGTIPMHIIRNVSNCDQILRILLKDKQEEQLFAMTSSNTTALQFVVNDNNEVATKILLESAKDKVRLLSIEDTQGYNCLHSACFSASLAIINALVEAGADINARGESGWTPLHIACCRGRFDLVDYLLIKGADINVGNDAGYTPLHIAAEENDEEHVKVVARVLAEENVIVDAFLKNKQITPLCRAVIFGCYDVAKLLVQQGHANVNLRIFAKNGQIITPLRLALGRACDLKMFKLLLSLGADPAVPLEDGITVHDIILSLIKDKELKSLFSDAIQPISLLSVRTIPETVKALEPCLLAPTPALASEKPKRRKAPKPRSQLHPGSGTHFFPTKASTNSFSNIAPESLIMTEKESLSGRAFLRQEKQFTPEQLNQLELEKKERRVRQLVCSKRAGISTVPAERKDIPAETYFNGQLKFADVMPISEFAFCYFPRVCLKTQGCNISEKMDNMRLKFSHKNIKKLSLEQRYTGYVQFPSKIEGEVGAVNEVNFTHEYKIKGSLDRILLFEMSSDSGKSCLYIGAKFVPAGLHTTGQIEAVLRSVKSKRDPIKIDMPCSTEILGETSTLVSAKELSCSMRKGVFSLHEDGSSDKFHEHTASHESYP